MIGIPMTKRMVHILQGDSFLVLASYLMPNKTSIGGIRVSSSLIQGIRDITVI